MRQAGLRTVERAVGAQKGIAEFQIGENDESSSLCVPRGPGGHLVVKGSVKVKVATLSDLVSELGIADINCIKLDIEGSEIEVIGSIASSARALSPQWTVEFHDEPEFQLSSREQVDNAITLMRRHGFSVLVRNWPARTNVLFLDRKRLNISNLAWLSILFRYQYLAYFWRKLTGN